MAIKKIATYDDRDKKLSVGGTGLTDNKVQVNSVSGIGQNQSKISNTMSTYDGNTGGGRKAQDYSQTMQDYLGDKYNPNPVSTAEETKDDNSGNGGKGGGSSFPTTQIAAWVNPYQADMDERYRRIMNRDEYSFDLYSNNLYRQYRDQYEALGNQAMQDTIGQASALTGGYGSTYAENAGQQAYQNYLSQLNAIVPEIYDRDYAEFNDEQNWNLQAYALAQDRYDRAITERDDNRTALIAKIRSGYTPTDEELYAAGMTWQEAKAYRPSGTTQKNDKEETDTSASNSNRVDPSKAPEATKNKVVQSMVAQAELEYSKARNDEERAMIQDKWTTKIAQYM